MVDFFESTTPEEKAERLGRMLPDQQSWQNAVTFIYGSMTEAFYDVARQRNYHAGDCRGFLVMNMLYHICNLAVESGVSKEAFLDICSNGFDTSMEMASEDFKTQGNA